MSGQLAVVGLILAAALLYLVRAGWGSWKGARSGCGGGCGCKPKRGAQTEGAIPIRLISPERLTLRPKRKEER